MIWTVNYCSHNICYDVIVHLSVFEEFAQQNGRYRITSHFNHRINIGIVQLFKQQIVNSRTIITAIKARVLKTEDFGSYIHIHVSIKRVFKEGKIRLNKKKMMIFPASWMEMGCTCPVLIPSMWTSIYALAQLLKYLKPKVMENAKLSNMTFCQIWNESFIIKLFETFGFCQMI